MIRYISGKDTFGLRAVAQQRQIGLMIQPGNRYYNCVRFYPFWAADNGMFTTKSGGFSAMAFLLMLLQPLLKEAIATCLFVAAPDVLIVHADGTVTGNAEATLQRFPMWRQLIYSLGFPVALVAQDGLEHMLDRVPWQDVDVLFIGGSTEWKLSSGAKACVDEARRRGKRTHMGRVNSYKRLALANSWGMDTADGTFLKYGPETNLPHLLRWLDKLEQQ